jgi:hypothetical protein
MLRRNVWNRFHNGADLSTTLASLVSGLSRNALADRSIRPGAAAGRRRRSCQNPDRTQQQAEQAD